MTGSTAMEILLGGTKQQTRLTGNPAGNLTHSARTGTANCWCAALGRDAGARRLILRKAAICRWGSMSKILDFGRCNVAAREERQ